ncbi:MAG: DUF2807 domain-containing protein [Spirochaetaceae bacterium]|nr:DUF2807 domain-containing protein [Spirochaetaceae bacterium]
MKKIVLFIMAFVLVGIHYGFSFGIQEYGNGDIITIDRTISSSFDGIHLETGATVNLYQNPEQKISITVDSNIEKFIQTEIKNGILDIKYWNGYNRPTQNIINIYTPGIQSIAISGSGTIVIADKITTDSLKTHISGSGEIEGPVECDTLAISIFGSGDIKLNGRSREAEISISGSGDVVCDKLQVNNADIRISGSGAVLIDVADNLKGRIFGSGNILYLGTPRINFRASGSGKISILK